MTIDFVVSPKSRNKQVIVVLRTEGEVSCKSTWSSDR